MGIDDPEQWLEDAPKRIVDLWEEYWKLEPWGLPWHQSAQTNMLLDWILTYQVSVNGGRRQSRSFTDFMPIGYSESTTEPASNLLDKLAQIAKGAEKATQYYDIDDQQLCGWNGTESIRDGQRSEVGTQRNVIVNEDAQRSSDSNGRVQSQS